MSRFASILLIAASLVMTTGCVRFDSKRGVHVAWQEAVLARFKVGETHRQDVLKALGPPSQIIALERETVLYYLFEKTRGEGMILILYNQVDIDTDYDRAVFFFDSNDLLTEFSSYIRPDNTDNDD
jgi:outer membrane protein assembly factor BamE (lipoprotein component of BamABCDE complex)